MIEFLNSLYYCIQTPTTLYILEQKDCKIEYVQRKRKVIDTESDSNPVGLFKKTLESASVGSSYVTKKHSKYIQ